MVTRKVHSSLPVQAQTWWSIPECKFRFAATEILDLIDLTYFYGIRQMWMKDRWISDLINPTFIALTATAIHHSLSAWATGQFRVPPEFGPGGGAQCKCNTRNIHPAVNNACADVVRCFDVNFRTSLPQVQTEYVDTISSMICRRNHSTGMECMMAQSHNTQGSIDEDFHRHIPEELIEQRNHYFHSISSFVADTDACIRFLAVLPNGGSANASSSQPVPCSDRNNHDITHITNIENMGFVDGSTIVEGAMSLAV